MFHNRSDSCEPEEPRSLSRVRSPNTHGIREIIRAQAQAQAQMQENYISPYGASIPETPSQDIQPQQRHSGLEVLPDSASSSNIERTAEGQQQANESLLDRLDRMLQEQPPRENQRANETLHERAERLAGERLRFLHEAASHPYDREAFTANYMKEYKSREREKRGISKIDGYSLNEEKISEKCKIGLEWEIIRDGQQTITLDAMVHLVTEDVVFNRAVFGLNKIPPNRFSPEWAEFRVEKYESIKEEYNFDSRRGAGRELMLADVMQIERSNRSSIDQLKSEEYKVIVSIVLHEWEAWKRDNNITE